MNTLFLFLGILFSKITDNVSDTISVVLTKNVSEKNLESLIKDFKRNKYKRNMIISAIFIVLGIVEILGGNPIKNYIISINYLEIIENFTSNPKLVAGIFGLINFFLYNLYKSRKINVSASKKNKKKKKKNKK
ncbi:hypothetical protein U732_129 [Clostridium argentinense CDC 2741]|uniref:Uncharacterized protein n=2 Tax=Clostridium argentinense TaxID=29341 RepID=A0A0C1UA46_9CLOT|nr:hypothetical protein [Clostridium argentinense]ARC83140.1 hypothetical protein RSJ17_00370 [Clostridium argentinense]KIE44450.1 hypothetical protein U732_129 [Clostridium argentinense CDC 2741]NFF41620.1 hypothetical protein [Clostridium argentinense]NFP52320.1 hypothetical protein [Clostridium argentinense]NFP74667.1 hypothetical protein [Clostridium argentinense]